jgi:hypothetical protein
MRMNGHDIQSRRLAAIIMVLLGASAIAAARHFDFSGRPFSGMMGIGEEITAGASVNTSAANGELEANESAGITERPGGMMARPSLTQMMGSIQSMHASARDDLERVHALRAKGNLTAEERAEYRNSLDNYVKGSVEERIRVAELFGQKGANQALVDDFVSFAQGEELKFEAASTAQEKRDLVVEFNAKWREFKQELMRSFVSVKLAEKAGEGEKILSKLNATIEKLAERGWDVSQLENISASIQARFGLVSSANTTNGSLWRLRYAYMGLGHMRNQMQNAINNHSVARLPEQSEPAGTNESSNGGED